MATAKILVTGGAGFIGSHLVDALIEQGNDVRILDSLDPQVHPNKKVPTYLNPHAEFIAGDVTDYTTFKNALKDREIVFHYAAAVGIGQSNYKIAHFVKNNILGTANLLDILANGKHSVKQVIVAASNTSYGEGLYSCEKCGAFHPHLRTKEDVDAYGFDIVCPTCKKPSEPTPTTEGTELWCNSMYAYTKRDQEDMLHFVGKTYSIPTTVLRFFNVYGPRQSLSNPYTGVTAIFTSRIKESKAPVIYEDGKQTRDFVSVYDVVEASIQALKTSASHYETFNVGTGKPIPISEVALTVARLFKSSIDPEITNTFRKGDIRHCFADTKKAEQKLGFKAKISFQQGMHDLFQWSKTESSKDEFDKATKELEEKGLL